MSNIHQQLQVSIEEVGELLDHITKDFNNQGRWRFLAEGKPRTKNQLLEAVCMMKKHGMEDKDITEILRNTFNNAYVEHEKQVKEATGLGTKEFFTSKVPKEDAAAVEVVATPVAADQEAQHQ